MDTAQIQIRRLLAADAALYREIRLEALRSHPEAFGSTFEAESVQSLDWFAERLDGANMFGAFLGAELAGIGGLMFNARKKEAHKGRLVAMYVRPGVRKNGVGRRLVQSIVEFAGSKVELVQLAVVHGNEEARRLYASLGFKQYGVEKNALKQEGRYYDEILMAKDLRLHEEK